MKIWRPWVERITDGSPDPHIWRLHLVDWPFRFYLHHIVRADHDRFLHNHPRPFISVVFWGGYVEKTCVNRDAPEQPRSYGPRFRGARWFNRMAVERFHRIVWVEPNTWTLLLGRYRKEPSDWGFLVPLTRDIVPQTEWVNHPDRVI